MKKLFLLCLFLSGCASTTAMEAMTPEQITAMAKAKDANVVCTQAGIPVFGTVRNVYVNIDKGVIVNGTMQVDGETCSVTFTNAPAPK